MHKEIWKDIQGFEGVYKISDLGRVYSCAKDLFLKPANNGNGYLFVNLCKDKSVKRMYIHRLVCLSFLGEDKIKKQVNHIDLNKANNNLNNLEWVTPRENSIHRYKNIPSKLKGRGGKKHHNNKKVIQMDINGNFIKIHYSMTLASKETNTNLSSISTCCNGNRKKANGYLWRYL